MSTCTDVSGGSKTAAWRPKLGQCQSNLLLLEYNTVQIYLIELSIKI